MIIPLHDENPTERSPIVTVALIVINVLCLLYTQHLGSTQGPIAQNAFVFRHGFVPARVQQIVDGKPIQVNVAPQRIVRQGFGQRIIVQRQMMTLEPKPTEIAISAITAMFLHGNWYHLLSNMWFFWIFGNNIEDRLGHFAFLLFYLAGGLAATACHALMTGGDGAMVPVIGASGAVAVTLGAYAVFYPWANVRSLVFIVVFFTFIDIPALIVLGVWFGSQLFSGIQALRFAAGTGVAWWAHIGGFVAGALMMPLIARREPEKDSMAWHEGDETPSGPFRQNRG